MKRNVPYAIILPIGVVCFAFVLMVWAMVGTSGGRSDNPSGTTSGSAVSQRNEPAVRVPTLPNNDTASDSARTTGPLNKSR
jgi:hypothetical protein